MIEFSNGYRLTFACGSGALGFDGRGWWWEWPLRWIGMLDPKAFTVVAKTVTRKPRKGNLSFWHPWTCVRLVSFNEMKGATNAVGLTNPGIKKWVERDYPMTQWMHYPTAASIKPDDCGDCIDMQRMLNKLSIAYVEVNLSCPNLGSHNESDLRQIIRMLHYLQGNHPLVLKLSRDQAINESFIRATEPFVEAFHAINTIPWDEIFKYHDSPIKKYKHGLKGGVSGQWIKDKALKAIARLRQLTDRPIIGGGGIMSFEDVCDFTEAGASAFSIGTCFLTNPTRPNKIVREYRRALDTVMTRSTA